MAPVNPQPPKTDPIWDSEDTGGIYQCVGLTWTGPGVITRTFWLPVAPGGPPPVDPVELAHEAIAKMGLRAINIGIVPEPGPDSIGLVGAPVWMWIAQPGPQSYGPQTATAAAGGVTVTATAQVTEIDWSMGDGHTVNCDGPGSVYQDDDGLNMSPTCGYKYTTTSTDQPGKVFPISATSYWTVTWNGGGQNGTIPLQFTANTQIRVGEAEAIQVH